MLQSHHEDLKLLPRDVAGVVLFSLTFFASGCDLMRLGRLDRDARKRPHRWNGSDCDMKSFE